LPSLEQIYEKLANVEKQLSDTRDGFSILDDTVADFFNINTLPGNEPTNSKIEKLQNIEVRNGVATIIKTEADGELLSASTSFNVEKPKTVSLRPVNEDIRGQFSINPNALLQEEIIELLPFVQNNFSQNIEILDNNGQRDFGAHLSVTETSLLPYQRKWDFSSGTWGSLWTLDKSNILWNLIQPDINTNSYLLQCRATEPFTAFPLPQYNMHQFGIALWGDIQSKEISEIKASMTTTEGQWVRMGLAIRMRDALNGYIALVETDITGSFISLYKIVNGFISLLAKEAYSGGDFVLNKTYQLAATAIENNIKIFVDDVLALEHSLVPMDIVAVDGDFGIVAMATSTVQFNWLETFGTAKTVVAPLEGSVTTSIFTPASLAQWTSFELDSSILQGRVEIDYSLDGGLSFIPIPIAVIDFPAPVTKLFDLTTVPLSESIIFRARLYNTGTIGWLRGIKLRYLPQAESPYVLENVMILNNSFQLENGAFSGSLTTKQAFLPSQIYSWDKIILDNVQTELMEPLGSLNNRLMSVTVDSHQDPYVSDNIIDASLATYWESKRGTDSWIIFDFADLVEIHKFRWVKKSPTDSATFYSIQVYNEEKNEFIPAQTFGYEVNADITHTLDVPVKGRKFRIYINCVQPMSFGNARFIDLFGRAVFANSVLQCQYSIDNGVTFINTPEDKSLSNLPIHEPVKFRIIFNRSKLNADLFLREANVRFIGRDRRATQITDLQYDVWIGDKFIYNLIPFVGHDIRCIHGNNFQIKIRFLINPNFRFEGIKPWLSGYRVGVSCSQYQEQIDELQAHINSVIWRADRDPGQDKLVDAVLGLIAQEIEHINNSETDVDKVIIRLMSYLKAETSKNRSRIVLGDTGHLDEVLPSELFNANILL